MDDLAGKISELLSDPGAMEQIMSLTGMLGGGDSSPLQSEKEEEPVQEDDSPFLSADTMQTVMQLMPLLSNLNKDDDTTRLLHSLRPFLGTERQQKLDQAAKILQLIKMLPMIKELNIL